MRTFLITSLLFSGLVLCLAQGGGWKSTPTAGADSTAEDQIEQGETLFFYQQKGKECLERNDYAKAKLYFQRVLKEMPDDIVARRGLAAAEQGLARQQTPDPTQSTASEREYYEKTADNLAATGDYTTALEYYKRLLTEGGEVDDLRVKIANVYALLGVASTDKGEYGDAVVLLGDGLRIFPESEQCRDLMASTTRTWIGRCLDEGKLDDALSVVTAFKEAAPQRTDLERQISAVYEFFADRMVMKSQFADAASLYRQAAQLDAGRSEVIDWKIQEMGGTENMAPPVPAAGPTTAAVASDEVREPSGTSTTADDQDEASASPSSVVTDPAQNVVPLSRVTTKPKLVHQVAPQMSQEYRHEMRYNMGYKHSKLMCRILVAEDGSVIKVISLSADPPATRRFMVDAAERALLQWTYKPALLNDVPVKVWLTLVLNFEGRD